jgi:DNA-binding response OmpR family regulator
MRILLVEDQQDLAHQVARRIERGGFSVDHVATVHGAMKALSERAYMAAILDRRLPDGDGLTIVVRMRSLQPDSRAIVMTALDKIDDRIAGLDAGADDYLVKPFDLEELMARIRACLRRSSQARTPPATIGALTYDFDSRSCAVEGRAILLHRRELALLEGLVRRAGVVVRRETLTEEIWNDGEAIQPHALTLLAVRLRAKLDQAEARIEIHAARGVGYLLTERAP